MYILKCYHAYLSFLDQLIDKVRHGKASQAKLSCSAMGNTTKALYIMITAHSYVYYGCVSIDQLLYNLTLAAAFSQWGAARSCHED